jgi:hypothetical protein
MRHVWVVVASSLALAASGCSIIGTTGAPSTITPGPKPPDCTTSKLLIYGDGALSAGAVGTSLFLGIAALGDSENRSKLGYATLFTFLGSIPFAVSGIVGGARVRSCRRAHEQWRAMQPYGSSPYGPPYGPSPYGPPPPPTF